MHAIVIAHSRRDASATGSRGTRSSRCVFPLSAALRLALPALQLGAQPPNLGRAGRVPDTFEFVIPGGSRQGPESRAGRQGEDVTGEDHVEAVGPGARLSLHGQGLPPYRGGNYEGGAYAEDAEPALGSRDEPGFAVCHAEAAQDAGVSGERARG